MSNLLPQILVFASGGAKEDEGGSGFRELVLQSRPGGVLLAEIVGVVSNHLNGGVARYADELGVPFVYLENTTSESAYRGVVDYYTKSDGSKPWCALSGWLKKTNGLDPKRTFNIHPGPLPRFGGKGMYGHHVHEAVMKAYRAGELTHSDVTMHFVDDEYDRGPVFFRMPVPIRPEDDALSLGKRVNAVEHAHQAFVTNLVVHGRIHWDGVDPNSLVVPEWLLH